VANRGLRRSEDPVFRNKISYYSSAGSALFELICRRKTGLRAKVAYVEQIKFGGFGGGVILGLSFWKRVAQGRIKKNREKPEGRWFAFVASHSSSKERSMNGARCVCVAKGY
jgi:hypothetical protein